MPAFALSKWYADCVDDQGAAAIVYHAELRWRAASLHYSSLLTRRPGHPAQVRYSLRKRPSPAMDGEHLKWNSTDWNAEGCWRELGASHREVLFKSDSGSLDWHCIAPRAAAKVQIGKEPAIEGWGYAEHLHLTVAPWQLPIRRLRWGRFVNSTDALTWIDWSGTYSRRVVYFNGSAMGGAEITDSDVTLTEDRATLSLDRGIVLRDGKLGSTALAMIPNLARLFPDSILNIRECKWLSRAVLSRPGQPDSVGMAIHEVVEWP